jgi:transcriptional regulator with XRE-family HTH domain
MATNEKRLAQRMGASIRRLRQARDWSQAELAEKVDVSVDYVGLLERGLRLPAVGVLVQISEIFRVSTDEVLGREGEADDWLREATNLLSSVPPRVRGIVLAMLRGAVRE